MTEKEQFDKKIQKILDNAKAIKSDLEPLYSIVYDEYDRHLQYKPASEIGKIHNLQSDYYCAKGSIGTVIHCLEQIVSKLNGTYQVPPPIGFTSWDAFRGSNQTMIPETNLEPSLKENYTAISSGVERE